MSEIIPTSTFLKAIAANYLRYQKHCILVISERDLGSISSPDVLAVTKDRRLIEIEVKISLDDFKKDAKKKKWGFFKFGEKYGFKTTTFANQFYYIVPPNLKEKALEFIAHEKIGLLSYGNDISVYTKLPEVEIIKKCGKIHDGKLSIKDTIHMVRHQSGTLCSLFVALAKQEQILKNS